MAMAEPATRRVATYERVSSPDQRERETIKTQTDTLDRRLALETGIERVKEYRDDGVSGTIALADRPAGRELLRDAAAGLFDELWVATIDRLGRDAPDVMLTRRRLSFLGIRLMTPAGEVNPLVADIEAVIGDHARVAFLLNAARGMKRAASEGRYTGGIIAYGYRVEGTKEAARPIPDERSVTAEFTAAGVVRRIYGRLGLDQVSCAIVADELNALGIPTHYSRDGRGVRGQRTRGLWMAGRIRNMVINPIYRGELQYGRRTKKHDRELITAAIQPLVSPELWAATQATLARNRVCAKNTRRVYLLRGVIRCAVCGLTYVGSQGRKETGWYRCNGKNRDRGPLAGRCTGRMVRTDALDEPVWTDIERYLRDPGDVLAELAGERDGSSAIAEAEAIIVRRALAGLDQQRTRALALNIRGRLPDAELDAELDRIATEQTELGRRLAAVDAPGTQDVPALAPDLLAELRARLDAGLAIEARQEIVRLLVGQIVIHTEELPAGTRVARAVVHYRFPGAVQTDTGMGSWPR